MAQILADPQTAPISAKLKAMLAFLRKMTLEPTALTPEDARTVLATGVSKPALQDAIHVAYLFNIYDRLADALGWHVPDASSGFYKGAAKRLLTKGYA